MTVNAATPDNVAPSAFELADLDYALPDELIAQHPLPARDASRLLVLDREAGALRDSRFGALPEWLRPGDLLVLNDTGVLPARFTARRETGGRIGGLFIKEEQPGMWRVLLENSKRLRIGETLSLRGGEGEETVRFDLIEAHRAGQWRIRVEPCGPAGEILARVGRTPLPPYIRRSAEDPVTDGEDRLRYETVYARHPGAIAAPTAGLHFTDSMLDDLRARGIETATVTLHVGVGTFNPIRVSHLSQHVMHDEWYELNTEAARAIERCRQRDGRVVAVGTTTVRVLESAATNDRLVQPHTGMTDIFIYPPYRIRVVDALITNFHLPGSTLLALVMAMAGPAPVREAYRHAVAQRYRFYSFGDAMLIL